MSGPNPTERLDDIRLAISFGHELDNDAAKQLERALAASERIGTDALGELAEARAEAARLRVALEFYADPGTYFAIGFFHDPPCGAFMEDFEDMGSQLGMKPGKRARAALAPAPGPAGERQGE